MEPLAKIPTLTGERVRARHAVSKRRLGKTREPRGRAPPTRQREGQGVCVAGGARSTSSRGCSGGQSGRRRTGLSCESEVHCAARGVHAAGYLQPRSEEHTSELQSQSNL